MIKLVLTDCDGVLTDNSVYYDNKGNELLKFNKSDTWGVKLLHEVGIKVGIITGERSEAIKKRAEKMNVDFLCMGAENKLGMAKGLCEKMKINLSEVAFIGNDINDISLLKEVFSAVTNDATFYVWNKSDIKLVNKGGCGAFREFAQLVILKRHSLDNIIDSIAEKNL